MDNLFEFLLNFKMVHFQLDRRDFWTSGTEVEIFGFRFCIFSFFLISVVAVIIPDSADTGDYFGALAILLHFH